MRALLGRESACGDVSKSTTPVATPAAPSSAGEARTADTASATVTAGPALLGGAGDLDPVPALSLSAEFVPGADVGVGVARNVLL